MNNLAINLRILRDKKHMTQAQVSEQLKLGEKVLSNYENGKREPDYDLLIDLADFYGVTVDELLRANKETEEYCAKLQKLNDEYLCKSFSEMIASTDLWKKYQNTVEERNKLWEEHEGDNAWLEEYFFKEECEFEFRASEASEMAMRYELDDARKEYEDLLTEGQYKIFSMLISVVMQEDELEQALTNYDEISQMENELEMIEEISTYCAIAHKALTGHLNSIFEICSGGVADEG